MLKKRVHGVPPYGDEVCLKAVGETPPIQCMISLFNVSTNQNLNAKGGMRVVKISKKCFGFLFKMLG